MLFAHARVNELTFQSWQRVKSAMMRQWLGGREPEFVLVRLNEITMLFEIVALVGDLNDSYPIQVAAVIIAREEGYQPWWPPARWEPQSGWT